MQYYILFANCQSAPGSALVSSQPAAGFDRDRAPRRDPLPQLWLVPYEEEHIQVRLTKSLTTEGKLEAKREGDV